MKKVYKKLARRFESLKPEIKWVFLVAFISILVIELILKNWNSPNDFLFHLGDIYIKICFSIVAATIFYFLNQHLPREDKKVKSSVFFNNKIKIMESEITSLIRSMGCEPYDIENITREIIIKKCQLIKPTTEVIIGSKKTYPNWKVYLDEKLEKIKWLNNELLNVYDLLDNSMLESTLSISSALHISEMLQGNMLEKGTLNDSGAFISLMADSQRELNKSLSKLAPYLKESSEEFRKRKK
jgi:hypothetical protein